MADKTVDVPIQQHNDEYSLLPLGAVAVKKGWLMCNAGSGNKVVKAGDTAGYAFVGISTEPVDNSGGSAGDKNITVYHGPFEVESTETETDDNIGALRYVTSNYQVAAVGSVTNNILVGRILRVISSSRVVIDPRVRTA